MKGDEQQLSIVMVVSSVHSYSHSYYVSYPVNSCNDEPSTWLPRILPGLGDIDTLEFGDYDDG